LAEAHRVCRKGMEIAALVAAVLAAMAGIAADT
jgi:hypothetical protein